MGTIDSKKKALLLSIYNSIDKQTLPDKGEGWINLVKFAPAIKKAGIDYHSFGYDKVGDFLKDSGDFFVYLDNTTTPPVKYVRLKVRRPRPVASDNTPKVNVLREDSDEVKRLKTRLRLENNQFIGQFSPERTEGWYKITDIRNTDFTKIEDKERGVKDLTIFFSSPKKFNRCAYYRFTWVLLESEPLKFGIDKREEIVPVYPRDIVRCLHDSIIHYPASAAKKITRTLDTLNKQLTQSGKEVFIYELLQNANDYPKKQRVEGKVSPVPVDVEFHITSNFLTFQHTGEYFNPKNIAAICDINDGEKSDNVEAIGYKGIGFKTVFLDNDYVYLNTGNYSFRFDKDATDVINTPWQILPVWTDGMTVHSDIKEVFGQHENELFRVKFALQPRDKRILSDRSRKDNYIDLFSDVFKSERVILFIPNIQTVKVFFGNTSVPSIIRKKDTNDWCVSEPLSDDIPEEIRERINEVLTNPDADKSDGYEKIPEKYMNFYKTAVKFACKKDGRKLLPVDDAILYCYLPAKRAEWGFKFLMNTDMVPNGPRDDIEDIELNHEITKIAGRQFFYWIKSLIASEEYELDSIFQLIPDFDECKKKKQYKEFIEEFQEEFETLIKEEEFIPVVDAEGNKHFERINNIIDDRTGLTKNNVMSDTDFIQLMDMSDHCLPVQELRESECFMDLLYHYCPGEMDVDYDDVKKNCTEENFKTWLKDLENNTKFIKHLLDNNKLKDFAQKTIFVEFEGDLYEADELYFDFDTNCSGIAFLKTFVPHLCDHTRVAFQKDENWKSFTEDYFKEFDAENIINDYIIDNEDAMSLLKNIDNSVSFIKFVAENGVDLSDNKEQLPYITEDDEASTNYEGLLLFYSEDAYNTSKEEWLGDNVINILSHTYLEQEDSDSIKTVFEQLGFSEFNKFTFITDTVSGDSDFRDTVNETVENDFDKSVAFFKYLYAYREELKDKTLLFKDYVVSCIDIDGDESYLCNDDLRYFDQEAYAGNSTFADNKEHEWINYTMMYSLNPLYFDAIDENETKSVESFFRQQFGIKTFTDKSFFADVVLKNKKAIYATLTDAEKMTAFLAYLRRDANHIFDGSLSYNEVKDMPLLCADGTVISERDKDVRLVAYNEDASALYEKDWCPVVFKVMSKEYGLGFSKEVLQLLKIEDFDLNQTIVDIIDSNSLDEYLEDEDNNVDFWRWIVKNFKNITDFDVLKSVSLLDSYDECSDGEFLYISDVYQQDGIETLVKKYDKSALFVSTSYLENEGGTKKEDWLKLFKKLGLKSDNKDILFNSILPNLDTLVQDSVAAMMTKHIKDMKEVWNERKEEIKKLQVRTKSGEYKTINQTLIINIQEESVVEPFKYIELSNEIASDVLEGNKELLLLIAKEYGNGMLVSEKRIWAEKKIAEYLDLIQEDEDRRDAIHVNFVRELAKIVVDYDISTDLMERIKYRVMGNSVEYKSVDDITLGSAYSPICDFQANGVDALSYLSEIYIFEGNKDTIKTFFKSQGLHYNMTREDLKYLAIREFACYFWSYCFSRRLGEYKNWMEEGLFNDIVCVPTERGVKKAEELYCPWMVVYAAKSPGWRERVPLKTVVDKIESRDARELFNKLPFNSTLSFKDCLHYLLNAQDKREDERQRREHIVNWILEADETDEELVDSYRNEQNALWRNGKGQKKHISDLYAIHPDASQERAIFSGDEHVMLTNMFPYDIEQFEEICDILKIKCLTEDDFVSTPINKVNETEGMMRIIKPRLLVLAAIQNPDKYKEIYETYNELISKFQFYVCDKIDLGYDTIHNDVERIYNDDSHIYYVNSWLHNRTYTKFCSKLKNLLHINVYDNVCEDVLDGNVPVEASIEKYCSALVYDEEFRAYLENLDCSVSVEEEETEVINEDDYYSDTTTDTVEETESEEDAVNEPESEDTNTEQESDADEDYELISEEEYEVDDTDELEAMEQSEDAPDADDFIRATYEHIIIRGEEDQVVCEHYRSGTWVRGHWRNGYWVNGYWRNGSNVSAHTREGHTTEHVVQGTNGTNSTLHTGNTPTSSHEPQVPRSPRPEKTNTQSTPALSDDDDETSDDSVSANTEAQPRHETGSRNVSSSTTVNQTPRAGSSANPKPRQPREPQGHSESHSNNYEPREWTTDDIERIKSKGVARCLSEGDAEPIEIEQLNTLLGSNMSAEEIADTNYLAQMRLYQNLVDYGYEPEENLEEFIKSDKKEHSLSSGKYIHKCSAKYGIVYISPSIWNKVASGRCVVCVYLGKRANDFMYLRSIEDILKWIHEDDILIKLTGEEKVDVVKTLYSGVLDGVTGTAYTMIRVASNAIYNPVFAQLMDDPDQEDSVDDF